MQIEYNPPRKKQPFWAIIKPILRIFIRKKHVTADADAFKEPCIFVANHARKMGPVNYELFLPVHHVKWGAHQMLGKYKDRFHYLRDNLYLQKYGHSKALATFRAFFEAFFSGFFYKGLKLLPTYPDGRLAKTIRKSVEILKDGSSILIFPEDSSDGYHDEMTSFFPGFVMLMDKFKKDTGREIPVRAVYYHAKLKQILVGKAHDLSEFQGKKRAEIAEFFKGEVNGLYHKIIQNT